RTYPYVAIIFLSFSAGSRIRADSPSDLFYSSFALLIVAPDKKEKNLTDGQGYFSRTSVRFSTFLSKLHIMIVVKPAHSAPCRRYSRSFTACRYARRP